MKGKLALLFGALVLLLAASIGAEPAVAGAPAQEAAAASFPAIRINEVMPRPAAGGHDWVELQYVGGPFTLYLPILPKNAGRMAISEGEPAGAAPLAQPDVDISGWQVSDEDGNSYTLPAALPPIPRRAFVLIYFDGLGPATDDYDFSDGVAVLHAPAGLADIFEDAADQVALYRGSEHTAATVHDFVAYGAAPGDDAGNATAAGLWPAGDWTSLVIGSGAEAVGEVLPSRSTGLYPTHSNGGPGDWAVYQGADITPGAANPVPQSYWTTLADGVVMGSDGFALGWAWAPGATYQLQLDDDRNFGSPLVNTILDQPRYVPGKPPAAGAYWWRVRAILGGQYAAWSTPLRVTVVAVVQAAAAGDEANALASVDAVTLPITWLRQRKDTRLLCLDGDNEGDPAAANPKETWDAVHPDAIYTHGQNNCVRASIAMIATNYGGNLSQDRLSYQLFENGGSPIENAGNVGNPQLDLGHDHTTLVCGGDGSNGGTLLAWALGINKTDYTYGHIDSSSKPSFAQIRAWIDAGRPIMRFFNGHQTVIGGYRTLGDGTEQIRLFDPWTAATWESYSGVSLRCWYVPPASAPGVRSDEPGISADADGDGIMDWDEQVRFGTDPVSADTDGDWVQDKQDLREAVFDTAGNYNLRNADSDGDGLRKERDWDNDADTAADGCEDVNYNGKYEGAAGETDNFNGGSKQACVPKFKILQPTQGNPVNAGATNSPDKILVQVQTATPPASPVIYTAADFEVTIGGADSAVIAVYRVLDTHFLVVVPHTQAVADYHDLEVVLQGAQSDKQTRAVYYLPKLRADQMLVIDRSGSMLDDGKIDAAKNAARAFIDHSNVGDMIGVASYASSAGPAADYTLTTVTGDPEWNAAKAAVNGLTATGATALGQGTLLGYNEILARGRSDHDWAIALLSDGLENVAPYWSDPTVSDVIIPSRVIVHTVALGHDADRILMSAIAGATGGTPYESGVDLLPLAAGAAGSGAALEAAGAPESPAAMPGPNLPTTLPNRMADVYKAIGEEIGHQQRVWERTGRMEGHLAFEVPVGKGLPEAIFAVNWDDAKTPIEFTLTDPDGNQVKTGYPGMRFRNDATHQQYRIQDPRGGVWVVDLRTKEQVANYLFILSARSETTLHLAFGLPPEQRVVGAKLPILAVLSDYRPILGAEVWALVQGPNSDLVQTLQLFDDGNHQDGKADDGVYGNLFTQAKAAGAYVVKASGWGKNNNGEEFARHRTGGFTILPRAAYIWSHDLTAATRYRALLQADGFSVDLVHVDRVPKTSWASYNLALIGPETGDGASWGTAAAVSVLRQYSVPIIGLGEGGYAFFGQLGLAIGYANGWHGMENRTYVVDPSHPVWSSPYAIPYARDRIVTVYKKTANVGIKVLKPTAEMTLIGREPADETHYNVLQQTVRYVLWGFQADPSSMSAAGQHLFINLARHTAGM